MKLQPEFPRPIVVKRISSKGSLEVISALPDECVELARRMDVPFIHALRAELFAAPWRGGGVKVTGQVHVDLDQLSVVSLEVFRSSVVLEVERYFLTGNGNDEADPIDNGLIDLGEVAAETLALDLDPYPRKPDEAFSGFDTDVNDGFSETRVSPFRSLKPSR